MVLLAVSETRLIADEDLIPYRQRKGLLMEPIMNRILFAANTGTDVTVTGEDARRIAALHLAAHALLLATPASTLDGNARLRDALAEALRQMVTP